MKSNVKLNAFAFCMILFLSVFFTACCCCEEPEPEGCEKPFQVTSPEADKTNYDAFVILNDNRLVVTIVFNKSVDPSTLILGETIFFTTGGEKIPATLAFESANKRVKLTTDQAYPEFCDFNPDCNMELRILGDDAGQGVAKDAEGCVLDGDYDGAEGGNYKSYIRLLG